MKSIVAVDNNWGIGKGGGMCVSLPGDLKYFREQTVGKIVVMGRATFEALPGKEPLSDRVNIVLSRNPGFQRQDCIVCRSMGGLFKVLESYNMEDVFIIGGEAVYRQFGPYCNAHLVTKIDGAFDADRHYENLYERGDLELVWESEVHNDGGVEYRFTEYRRK